MRKAKLLIIPLIFFAARSSCQQEVFSCDYTGSIHERFNAHIIPEKERNFFIFSLITDRMVQRFYAEKDKSIPILEQHIPAAGSDDNFRYHGLIDDKMLVSYRRMIFAGGVYHDKKITEVLRSRMNADLYLFETDLVTGKTIITDTVAATSNEKIITCFNRNQEIIIVSYVDGTNQLKIYKKGTDGLKKSLLEIALTERDNQRPGNINTLSRKHFGVYDNNQRYHVLFTAPWDKAFIQNDKLVLLLTDKNADVYAVAVDTDSVHYKVKRFDPGGVAENSKVTSKSAFLVDSLLITAYANDRKLYLNIFHLDNDQLLFSKTIDESNIDSFLQEPIQRTGSFMSRSDMKEATFKKFYTTVKNNDLSVTAYADKGKLFLSFGAEYKQVINGTTLLNLLTSAAGTYMINASSDYYGYFISGFQGVRNSTYTSFDATLNLADLSPATIPPNFSVWEKITSFVNIRRIDPAGCIYFYMNNYYYIGFFESGSKKYVVHRFNEKGIE